MKKVLIVDDDEGVRNSLRMLLKSNYELSFAIDGRDAIAKFSAVRPDIVLLDLCMPEMSGLEALQSIKTLDPHAVAIIFTAYASLETAQNALRLGAFDYLIKPFDPRELEETIQRAIEHRIELLHLYLKSEAEQQRSVFLTYVAHELKTPLTPLIGAVELLKLGTLGPLNEKQIQAIDMAARQSTRLHRLINDLLDHFKLENGCMTIKPVSLQIAPLIADRLATYVPLFEKKGLSLRCAIPDNLVPVLFDPERFEQIIDNLLDNAYKYTEQGGVEITAEQSRNMVKLTIVDTGIGIEEEDIGRIFLPFYQVNSTLRGAGLGLTIVKQLVEAHGGSIQAESREAGQGSAIVLTLPAAPVRPDETEASPAAYSLT